MLTESVPGALEVAATRLNLLPSIGGVVLLAVISSAANLFAAVAFARHDRIGIVFNICIGSTIQVARVVALLLVLVSWALGAPLGLVFRSPLDLFAVDSAAFAMRAVAVGGETAWFEGLMLVAPT